MLLSNILAAYYMLSIILPNQELEIMPSWLQKLLWLRKRKCPFSTNQRSVILLSIDKCCYWLESDIYEDPSVRFESKKILQPDPTDMENYLVS